MHDAASAARGTVMARMMGIATRPALSIRRRARFTSGSSSASAGVSSSPAADISRSVVATSAGATSAEVAMVSTSRAPSIDFHTRAAGAFRQYALCDAST